MRRHSRSMQRYDCVPRRVLITRRRAFPKPRSQYASIYNFLSGNVQGRNFTLFLTWKACDTPWNRRQSRMGYGGRGVTWTGLRTISTIFGRPWELEDWQSDYVTDIRATWEWMHGRRARVGNECRGDREWESKTGPRRSEPRCYRIDAKMFDGVPDHRAKHMPNIQLATHPSLHDCQGHVRGRHFTTVHCS